jgi:2-succinyl-6-hydroxy-2,4-cyclohexadiene-1-carboxylate synthase
VAQLEPELPAGSFLVGYSLGARLALQLLLARPTHYRGAVLVGVHPGLEDPAARAERIQSDEVWAQRLERDGLELFFRAWDQQPLFAAHRRADPARERERRRHDPLALAATLRALSLGRMPFDPPGLGAITCPVWLVAGALDQKFVDLSLGLAGRLSHAELKVVEGAGHPLPEQTPERLAELIQAATER